MALFDSGTNTLEDVLGQTAENNVNTIDQQYAKKRRQSIAQAGASGRLGSGVYNYNAGDINAAEAGDVGNVYSGLSDALAQVPITDYTTSEDDRRNQELAHLLASLNKPSSLEEALSALSTTGSLAATGAALFA